MDMKSVLIKLRESSLAKSANSFFSKADSALARLRLPLPSPLRNSRIIAGVFVLILLIIFFFHSLPSSASNIPTFKVKKENFVVSITESGEIRAKNSTVIVTPNVQGSIKVVYLIPEGTYVKAGDVVVKFDPTEAMTNYRDAQSKLQIAESDGAKLVADQKSQLTSLQSALKGAQLSAELSKLNLEQMKFEAEIKQQQSKLELEKDQLNLAKAEQDLASAQVVQKSELAKMNIQVEQAKSTLEKAKRDLDALTLTAPKEGLVVYETNWSTGRKIMVGDTPWPGMPVVSLPDLSAMQSITYVNEVDVSRVHAGQSVLVRLDAFQDSTFTGVIASVAALGRTKDRNSTIKVFEVDVDIHSQSPILKPGMTTSNKIIIDQVPDVVYVPQESVFDEGGKKIVYVKDGSGFDKREVKAGVKNENYIVITRGVKPNDVVSLIDPNMKPSELENQRGQTVSYPSSVKQ